MNAQRWQEIQSTFEALVALDASGRRSRLTALARSDPELCAAVEALLAADLKADERLAPLDELFVPVPRPVLALSPTGEQYSDARFGFAAMQLAEQLNTALTDRYRIEREIGSGGMAIVYQAHDLRHDRLVALKVLNPELGAILGAKRFLEEIKVTANLQHPNLLPLFDSGEADGLLYYVMPYIEGESLRGRLTRELQLPIDEAVHIAASVAGALDYAHAHGVIHRDLKPENILLQHGEPMVADFGIALAVKRAGGERITQSGMSLGTPKYMSPEQATADRAIDARSDIYSLGVVLYEMLTGETPYTGASSQAIIAKILTESVPSVRVARPNVPEHVADAIQCAVEKIPADRWLTAGAFADALTGAERLAASYVPGFIRSPRRFVNHRAALFGIAGFVCGLSVALLNAWLRTEPSPPLTWHNLAPHEGFAPLAANPENRFAESLALSPDGSTVAYVTEGTGALAVRRLDELAPRLLVGTEGARCPSFSPDGRWILYRANERYRDNDRILKVPVVGGTPIVLADSAETCIVWTDRDEVIFGLNRKLFRIRAQGGPPVVLASLDSTKGIWGANPTQALPGGRAVLLEVSSTRTMLDAQLAIVSLPDGKITRLTDQASDGEARFRATYSRGHLVFQHGTSIVAAAFSLRSLKITGPEVTLLRDTVYEFATSLNGNAAYLSVDAPHLQLLAVTLDGRARVLSGKGEQISLGAAAPMDTAQYAWPRLSPDGRRVALELRTGTHTWDVFIYEFATASLTRLTTNFTGIRPLGWSANGLQLLYFRLDTPTVTAPRHLVSQAWDGSSPAREMFPIPGRTHDISFGPPHTYAVIHLTPYPSIFLLAPLDSPAAVRPLQPAQEFEFYPRISPDGKLLAYTGNETRSQEVYVRVLPTGPRIRISTSEGSEPLWSPDGQALYYRSGGYMMRASIATSPTLSVIRRDTLFRDVYETRQIANYDVFPGGRELLMIRSRIGKTQIGVLQNWPELFRPRAILH